MGGGFGCPADFSSSCDFYFFTKNKEGPGPQDKAYSKR